MSQLKIVVKDSQHLKKLIKEDVNHELDLGSLDVSNVTDMSHLFENSTRVDFSGIETWDMSKVKNIYAMFYNAFNFDHNIQNWNLDSLSLKEKSFDYFFNQVIHGTGVHHRILSEFSKTYIIDQSEFNTNLPISARFICSSSCHGTHLNDFILKNIPEECSLNIIDVSLMRDFAKLFEDSNRNNFKGINSWNTSNALSFQFFASHAKYFNEPLNNFDFSNCTDLSYFLASTPYNHPLKFNLNDKNALNCSYMLSNCLEFNSSLDCFDNTSFPNLRADHLLENCPKLKVNNLPSIIHNNNFVAVPLAASFLNSNLKLREHLNNSQSIDEYNDLVNVLNENYNFRIPLENKKILVCRNQTKFLEKIYNKDLSSFFENNYFYELDFFKGTNYQNFKCYLSSNSKLEELNKLIGSTEIFNSNFAIMELKDYVTLNSYLIDNNKELSWKALSFILNNDKFIESKRTPSLNNLNLYEKLALEYQQNKNAMNEEESEFFDLIQDLKVHNLLNFSLDQNQHSSFKLKQDPKKIIPNISNSSYKR